jgi:predicted phosphodiesterase
MDWHLMIWFLGDPHGRFDDIISAIKRHRPKAVVLLGDMECPLPLDRLFQSILDLTELWFIHGNHDADDLAYWDNLHCQGLSHRNLHGRVAEVAGIRIAGLGGTFDQAIWLPGQPDTGIQSYQDFVASLEARRTPEPVLESKKQRFLSSIYPDDYFGLALESADILVTHEAPSCHPYGYAEIDELAQYLGARQVFHGHHHDSLDYRASWPHLGFEAYGVPFRGIMSEQGTLID